MDIYVIRNKGEKYASKYYKNEHYFTIYKSKCVLKFTHSILCKYFCHRRHHCNTSAVLDVILEINSESCLRNV